MIAMLRISMGSKPDRAPKRASPSGRGIDPLFPLLFTGNLQRRSGAPHLGDQVRQIDLGTGADMTDDFGSAHAADLAAHGECQLAGQAIEKAAGVKITRAGGVDGS